MMTTNQIGPLVIDKMPAALPARSAEFPFGAGQDKFGFGFQIAARDGRAVDERSAGSYGWGGINNTHFWIDPKRGIGVIVMMQVLPFYNSTSMDVIKRFEHALYQQIH
jgi:CubicO group peptidase (beta-lactamase class C family)